MSEQNKRPHPVMLCILDGWGNRESKENNAIEIGNTPVWHDLVKNNPHTLIATSGLDVGLPDGQMGNSEVGHTNIGAGRVVMQDLPKIDQASKDGSLAKRPAVVELIENLKKTNGTCHLMGLMSPGGVHSHMNHIVALAEILDKAGVKVAVHAFLDGRDTPPDSAKDYVADFENRTEAFKNVKVATVSGRYYAMDRDNRWERVTLAFEALMNGKGKTANTAAEAIKASYDEKVFDEFVIPCVVGDYDGMKDGDAILFANFRADRAREIMYILADKEFTKCERSKTVKFCAVVGMTQYSADHDRFVKAIYPPEQLVNIFGEVVSKAGLKQLRIAETEKYAHVTFFFNGGEEKLFPGEDRILIPSPKVATYDLQPEMSAYEVCDALVKAIKDEKFDTIIVNFANGDMVGHTGVLEAAVKATEAVDKCLGKLTKAIEEVGGVMLVTADHGNCEMMKDEKTGAPYTAHTTFKVPAVLFNADKELKLRDGGRLADLAPTLLELLGLKQPAEMTGKSLLVK
ncbi:MAG: 2,3-bisphosphoglycerate-independent phosphoglycerate mutase [Alphaproteobacteria bacterium]|nr:2,3-bisphosphoglycerate-independent phosphoglycerate mutase [Alphaproteobacteria bacterium]